MRKDSKISGFKTPDNYFENFETQLFGRIEEENLPQSTGFKVPAGYFETLDDKVMGAIPASQNQGKLVPLYQSFVRRPKRYFGYAAAVAAILIVGYTIFNYESKEATTLDTIQLGLIDKYIEDGNLNMDLYEFTSYLESQDIPLIDFENQYISQTALEDYLLENMDEDIFIEER